jgi:hypothetical protein
MDNTELTWTIREYVRVNRKPYDMDEVDMKTQLTDIPMHVQEILKKLTVLDESGFDFDNEGFYGDVLDENEQIYLLKTNDNRVFFIDTQGYTYARYVGEIIGGIELLK